MQVFSDVMTEKSEKGGNRKRFIAVAQHFKVDAVLVIYVGQPGDGGVDGYHEEDSDNARALSDWLLRLQGIIRSLLFLFPWFQVVGSMHEYQHDGQGDSY
jgi:hypothetical protein